MNTNRRRIHLRKKALLAIYRLKRYRLIILLTCILVGVIFFLPLLKTTEPNASLSDGHPVSFDRPLIVGTQNYTQLAFDLPYESEWRQHAHLVVFGVLATDKPERQEMRNNQRSTWLRYPDVAKRSNAFEGLMLVLYAMAPSASIAPNISLSLEEEMNTHHDVLVLRMKEGAPSTDKVVGTIGGYGLSVQVSNARKRFFFMLYAYHAFPNSPFIAKGDDDMYMHVPEYLRMIRQLPRINTIYGAVEKDKTEYTNFPRRMALGPGYTVTRDILHDTLTDHTVNVLLNAVYTEDFKAEYYDVFFQHEDCTIGKVMDRLYSNNSTRRITRALPEPPVEDPRLPAVEGWGKAYMAYVRDPQHVPHTGRAVNYDGRYNVTFSFPPPNVLHAGNVLWVSDKCRMNNRRRPSADDASRLIYSHRPVTAEEYQLNWAYNQEMGEDAKMLRPHHIDVKDEDYFNDVFLVGLGECKTDYSV